MYVQSQIYSQLSSAQGIEQVQILLSSNEFESRSAVGRAVCKKFGFRDARGRFQISGCLKALRRLEQSGSVRLPDTRGGGTVAIASVRCCLKHLLSSVSEEPAIAPPTGSMSAKPKDAANAQSQPSQHCRSRTSGYTRCARTSGKYSTPDSLTTYGLAENLQS